MTHDEMIALIEAHRDGKTIQYRLTPKAEWRDRTSSGMAFNFADIDYRIKPKPLTLEECVRIALKEADEGISFEKSMGEKFLKLAKESGHV